VAARDRDAARVKELQAQRRLAMRPRAATKSPPPPPKRVARSADLALARWREGQKQRTAPGRRPVHDVMYRVGEWVPAGAPVVALLPPGAVKLRFFVPESSWRARCRGRRGAVSCDGCPPDLTAKVRYVSPQAEFTPPVIYSDGSRSKLVFMAEAAPKARVALCPGQPVDVRPAP
jgi:HlyD family secretion protein